MKKNCESQNPHINFSGENSSHGKNCESHIHDGQQPLKNITVFHSYVAWKLSYELPSACQWDNTITYL